MLEKVTEWKEYPLAVLSLAFEVRGRQCFCNFTRQLLHCAILALIMYVEDSLCRFYLNLQLEEKSLIFFCYGAWYCTIKPAEISLIAHRFLRTFLHLCTPSK